MRAGEEVGFHNGTHHPRSRHAEGLRGSRVQPGESGKRGVELETRCCILMCPYATDGRVFFVQDDFKIVRDSMACLTSVVMLVDDFIWTRTQHWRHQSGQHQ